MMVTLRAYSNPTDVLIAKARLDDHAIACAVADELAHLYGGAPFAMPIRLLVREEDVAEATRVPAELEFSRARIRSPRAMVKTLSLIH